MSKPVMIHVAVNRKVIELMNRCYTAGKPVNTGAIVNRALRRAANKKLRIRSS